MLINNIAYLLERWKDIGIYIYNVSYLERFVKLEQTQNEKSQKLEQLRIHWELILELVITTKMDLRLQKK